MRVLILIGAITGTPWKLPC